jgi:hypothetical protein
MNLKKQLSHLHFQNEIISGLKWLNAAARLKGKGPMVTALELYSTMFLVGKTFDDTFEFSFLELSKKMEMNECTAYRASKTLKEAGLITVMTISGKRPLVTLHKSNNILLTPCVSAKGARCTIFENLVEENGADPKGIRGQS